jgi:hypothetical protein
VLLAEVASRPPAELPGCAECPARCEYLHVIAPRMAGIGNAVGHRMTAGTSAGNRMRSLRDLVRQDPLLGPLVGEAGAASSGADRGAGADSESSGDRSSGSGSDGSVLDGKQRRDLLYCLVTVASARSGGNAADVRRALLDESAS